MTAPENPAAGATASTAEAGAEEISQDSQQAGPYVMQQCCAWPVFMSSRSAKKCCVPRLMSINMASSRSHLLVRSVSRACRFFASSLPGEDARREDARHPSAQEKRRISRGSQQGRVATRAPPTIWPAPHGKLTSQRPEHGCMCEPAPHIRGAQVYLLLALCRYPRCCFKCTY